MARAKKARRKLMGFTKRSKIGMKISKYSTYSHGSAVRVVKPANRG